MSAGFHSDFASRLLLLLFLELLHVGHELLMLLKVHLVVFDGDVAVRFEETLGEFEVLLLDLLDFTLSNHQIQTLWPEGY